MFSHSIRMAAGKKAQEIDAGPSGWIEYTDNTYWTPGADGFGTLVWSSGNSRWEYDGADWMFNLLDVGTWADGIRPTHWRVNYTVTGLDAGSGDLILKDTAAGTLSTIPLLNSIGTHQSADTAITFGANDIAEIDFVAFYYNPFYINSIEFFFLGTPFNYFDNTYWSPTTAVWTGTTWEFDNNTAQGNGLVITAIGGWATGFRPTSVTIWYDVTVDGFGGTIFYIGNTNSGILTDTVGSYSVNIPLALVSDITTLTVGQFSEYDFITVTDIIFYD